MIKQAAIMRDGEIWTLPRPARHHHIVWAMNDVDRGNKPPLAKDKDPLLHARGIQGFITDEGDFLDRVTAAIHAKRFAQLKQELIAPPNLYSEDLW